MNKYEYTPLVESSEVLNDFYRDTLKDFSPDKATFDHEKHSYNKNNSKGKLNTIYNGSRSGTDPYQPDLFLGDLTPDPRSIHDGPLMGKYQEQMWRRKNDYKMSFKNDSNPSITSGYINPKNIQINKKSTYKGFKERYKNFKVSDENIITKKDVYYNNSSLVDKNENDITHNTNNDHEQDKLKKETFISKNYSKVNNSINQQKLKNSNNNKLLKQKLPELFRKNKDKVETDIKESFGNNKEQQLVSNLVLETTNFMKNKKNNIIDKLTNKKTNSKEIKNIKINKSKEHFKNNEINTVLMSNKKSKLTEELNKKLKNKNLKDDFRKNISDFTGDKKDYFKGNNKENKKYSTKHKNDLIVKSLHKILKSNSEGFLSKGNNKDVDVRKKMDINKNKIFSKIIGNNQYENDTLNKSKQNIEIFNYKTKKPEMFDNYSNTKTSIEKKLQDYDKELLVENITQKSNYEIKDIDDYENDIDFSKAGVVKTAAGTVGKMGSKYLNNKKEYEDDLFEDDNIKESSTFNKKKYQLKRR